MTNLLNCSAHLKSTADLKPDAEDCLSLKSGLTLISDAMWKMSPSTTLSISHPWGAHHHRQGLPFPVSSQERQAFVMLHLCVVSSAAIISTGFCFLALLALGAWKLQSYLFSCQPFSDLIFFFFFTTTTIPYWARIVTMNFGIKT